MTFASPLKTRMGKDMNFNLGSILRGIPGGNEEQTNQVIPFKKNDKSDSFNLRKTRIYKLLSKISRNEIKFKVVKRKNMKQSSKTNSF
jgi:hypothetical protein